MSPNPQEIAVTFTGEILNGRLPFFVQCYIFYVDVAEGTQAQLFFQTNRSAIDWTLALYLKYVY